MTRHASAFSAILGCIECMRCRVLLPMFVVSVRHAVCLSITPLSPASLCKNGCTDQDPVWSKHSWEPKHCVGVLIPSQRGGFDAKLLWPFVYNSLRWLTDSNCTHIERLQERYVLNKRFVHFAFVEGSPQHYPSKCFPVLCSKNNERY